MTKPNFDGQRITLNGKTFSFGRKSMQDCDTGYFRLNTQSVALFDSKGIKVGVITKHRVLACASLQNGRWWYSYADIPCIGRYESISQESREIEYALTVARHLRCAGQRRR